MISFVIIIIDTPKTLVTVIPNLNIMVALRAFGTFCRLTELSQTQISQNQSIFFM